MNPTTQDLIL